MDPQTHSRDMVVTYPRVTDIISPWSNLDRVPEHRLEVARERGTTVHRTCGAIAKGLWFPPVAREHVGYVESFHKWFDQFVKTVHLVEEVLTDPAMGFQGTPDLIVTMIDDVLTLLDLKTPKVKYRIWMAQIAAYKHLATVNGYAIQRCGSLRLHPEGKAAIFDPCAETLEDFAGFHAALQAHRYFNA